MKLLIFFSYFLKLLSKFLFTVKKYTEKAECYKVLGKLLKYQKVPDAGNILQNVAKFKIKRFTSF